MQFDYEIPVDEYAGAQTLYYKARGRSSVIKRALGWIALGALFVVVASFRFAEWGPILLFLFGAWLLYCGLVGLFPAHHFRRAYPNSRLAGKKYHAEVDKNGFSVAGDSCTWRVLWSDAPLKAENSRVFVFSAKGTIFIFGKKYLTAEQQQEIRQFAAMKE